MRKEVIIVGGGLAGLTAAVTLARAGCRVRLFEKSEHAGGRAITQQKQGFAFNLGTHALYAAGAAARVLKDLNIGWRGRKPALGGYALMRNRAETMPAGAVSLLTTGLLKLLEKWEAVQWLGKLPKLDTAALQSVTLQQWLDENIDHTPVRQLFEALVRVATYANDPQRQSAGAALQQVQMAVGSGVYYLDGGFGLRNGCGPRFPRQVGVVQHAGLLGFQTRGEQDAFAVARFEHVEIEAYVRGEETLLKESGFAGGLDADEDDCLHCDFTMKAKGVVTPMSQSAKGSNANLKQLLEYVSSYLP
jgi:hypothetical protein